MPFKFQNPWKENLKDTPKESLNWRLWYGVLGEQIPTPVITEYISNITKSSV
jgi:hypothetical protein